MLLGILLYVGVETTTMMMTMMITMVVKMSGGRGLAEWCNVLEKQWDSQRALAQVFLPLLYSRWHLLKGIRSSSSPSSSSCRGERRRTKLVFCHFSLEIMGCCRVLLIQWSSSSRYNFLFADISCSVGFHLPNGSLSMRRYNWFRCQGGLGFKSGFWEQHFAFMRFKFKNRFLK